MSHMDPAKRHDFVLLFDVINGNPNGDPDAGNMPRTDAETMHGLVTDVCIKRKVRNYVSAVLQKEIFIQSEAALNTLYFQAFRDAKDAKGKPVGAPLEVSWEKEENLKKFLEQDDSEFQEWLLGGDFEDLVYYPESQTVTYVGSAKSKQEFEKLMVGEEPAAGALKSALESLALSLSKKAKEGKKPSKDAQEIVKLELARKYFDIRMFGAVLTAGTNAGQVRGPVQITFAASIDQIRPLEISITRVAITKPSDQERKKTEMGRKAIVPYALYRAHGFYNPLLARGLSVGQDDLKALWESLEFMFEHDRSAARPEMNTRGLYVFTHECDKGNAPAHKLFEKITVKAKGSLPQSFGDYRSAIAVPPEGPVEGVKDVSLKRIVHEAVDVS